MCQLQTLMKVFIPLLCVVFGSACSSGLGPVVPKTSEERQMIGLLQKFDLWDDDGSGDLDEKEVAAGLQGKGVPYTARQVIDFYDTSGDKRISLGEAQAAYSRAGELGARKH